MISPPNKSSLTLAPALLLLLLLLLLGGGAILASSHRRRSEQVEDRKTPTTTTTDDDGASSSSSSSLPAGLASLRLGHVDDFFPSAAADREREDAADWFDYGLLQLLAFGYDYSTPAFRRAREIDPNFELAYAFEALSCCFWPLWGRDDVSAANDVLDLIESDNVTDDDGSEGMYVGAIRAHFDASISDPIERHALAVEELRRVGDARPRDPTALALLGLWRISLSSELPKGSDDDDGGGGGEDESSSAASRMAQLAEEDLSSSLRLQPDHPGALHYSLHLYDHVNPDVHRKGLRAAEMYPRAAPDASHGQHMPVHILLRLGDFARSFDADMLALDAADKTCRLYGRSDDEGCDLWNLYHSLEYLQVEGYHCGRWDEALGMLDRMEENYQSAVRKGLKEAKDLRLFWMRMRAREVLERGMIDGALLSSLWGGLGGDRGDRPREPIVCPPPVEPLEAGFWPSHTESGYLLARGLCLLLTDAVEEEEVGRGISTGGGYAAVDEVVARMGQISDDYEAAGASDRTERYNAMVHAVHVSLVEAVGHFVGAVGAKARGADGGGDAEGDDDDKDRGGSKLGDHEESLRLFGRAMSDATAAEDGLREAWTASVPTVLFLSAHELHGHLLLLPPATGTADADDGDGDASAPSHGAGAGAGAVAAAMEEFRAAERERGPRLTTALGMARASAAAAAAAEGGRDDGDHHDPSSWSSSRRHYRRAREMMHAKNDGAALPFWDEVTLALGGDVGDGTGERVGGGGGGGGDGGDEDHEVGEDAAAGNVRGGGIAGPHTSTSSSSSSSRVVLTSWAVGSACGAALFAAARAVHRRRGDWVGGRAGGGGRSSPPPWRGHATRPLA